MEQISALLTHVSATPATPDEAAAAFAGARPELVRRHLEMLVLVGELREVEGGCYEAVAEPSAPAAGRQPSPGSLEILWSLSNTLAQGTFRSEQRRCCLTHTAAL